MLQFETDRTYLKPAPFLRDGIKKTPLGAVNLFGKLLTFGHLNNWSQGWARRLLRTNCGH